MKKLDVWMKIAWNKGYFEQCYNLTLCTYNLCFLLFILLFHYFRIACITTILLWFRLFKYLRAFKHLGSLIAVITAIRGDIFRYFFLSTIIFIPYVISFWVMFGGKQSDSLTGSAKKDLSNIFHVAVMTFRMTLIDSYPYDVSLAEVNE